jgi:hypothetical protein
VQELQQADLEKLLALSYVYVSRDNATSNNAFGGFLPFLVSVGEPTPGKEFESAQVARGLTESFGWVVSSDFVAHFVPDLLRLKLIERRGPKYYWTAASAVEVGPESAAQIESLKIAFDTFATDLAGSLLGNLNKDERLHQLAQALVSNRLFSEDALEAYASLEDREPDREQAGIDYVSARFVRHCYRNDRDSFRSLILLCQLGVVCNLASYFSRPQQANKSAAKLTVALDGPFLVDLLGFCGEDRRGDAELIVRLARQRKARILLFSHSLDEARDVVRGVLNNHPAQRYGPTAAALRSGAVRQATLDAFVQTPRQFVENLRAVDEIMGPGDRRLTAGREYFSDGDWQAFYATLSEWTNDLARRRDCDSVRNVMWLRNGHGDADIWKSQSILLTSNLRLARAARVFCIERDMLNEKHIPPVMSRGQLAALLWLSGGAEEKSEILTTHLLSAASAFLSRDRSLIERVQLYALEVGGERRELVDAFVRTQISYEFLQDATLGGSRPVDDRALDVVLDRLVQHGREEGAEVERRRLEDLVNITRQDSVEAVASARAETNEVQRRGQDAIAAQQQQFEVERAEVAKAELVRTQKARSALLSLLSARETTWSRRYQPVRRTCQVARWVLIVALPMFSVTALAVLANSGLLAVVAITSMSWIAGVWAKGLWDSPFIADAWAQNIVCWLVEADLVALNNDLGPTASKIDLSFVDDSVLISNKEKIADQLTN